MDPTDLVNDLKGRIERLSGQVGQYEQILSQKDVAHKAEFDSQNEAHRAALSSVNDEIQQLRRTLIDRDRALEEQSVELAMLAPISEAEASSEVADYQRENSKLVTFVQKVADSRTKFAKDAKGLLGQETS